MGRRRGPRRGEGGAPRGGRVPARPQALRTARSTSSARDPSPWASGHREDARREGGRERIGRELLLAERVVVRRDVRRTRRRAHPQALRGSTQARPRDRVHRRARRRRHGADGRRLPPRARPDAEPAPRRARRLQRPRRGRRHGRVEPAPGSRRRTLAPRPLRPPGARLGARRRRPRGDPVGAHARQAPRIRRRPRRHRAADGRSHGSGSREPVQRGRDLRRPLERPVHPAGSTSTPPWIASSPGFSSAASSRRRRSGSLPTTRPAMPSCHISWAISSRRRRRRSCRAARRSATRSTRRPRIATCTRARSSSIS